MLLPYFQKLKQLKLLKQGHQTPSYNVGKFSYYNPKDLPLEPSRNLSLPEVV